jgi:transcriptional regulator with XRE-family HTH domain
MDEADAQGNRIEELGQLLRRLRAGRSLREVTQLTGVSSSYLSKIERGERPPGPSLLRKLAVAYNVDPEDLLRRAGHLGGAGQYAEEAEEVERAYQYVLADPQFRVGTRPDGPLSLNAKRFIVEMYERFTGKRLLE